VIDEQHRNHAIKAFAKYCSLLSEMKKDSTNKKQRDGIQIESYKISDINNKFVAHDPSWTHCVYILRLGSVGSQHKSIAAIPNRNDRHGILYIGGHPSGKNTARFNKLIKDCFSAELLFKNTIQAHNDRPNNNNHPVANCLTTSLLQSGFKIGDCELDLICGLPDFDELEFIIGYQEKYHHTPPWNASRKGMSGYSLAK